MKRHRLRRGSRDHLTQRYTMPLSPTNATTTLVVGRCASEAPAPLSVAFPPACPCVHSLMCRPCTQLYSAASPPHPIAQWGSLTAMARVGAPQHAATARQHPLGPWLSDVPIPRLLSCVAAYRRVLHGTRLDE
jgi:hypothetical protein